MVLLPVYLDSRGFEECDFVFLCLILGKLKTGSFVKSTVGTLEESLEKIQFEGRGFPPVPSFKEMDKGGREGETDRGQY